MASEDNRIDQLDPYVLSPQAGVSESTERRVKGWRERDFIMFLAIGGDIGPVKQQFFRGVFRNLIVLLSLIQSFLHRVELKGLVEITQNHKHIAHEETDTSKSPPWSDSST